MAAARGGWRAPVERPEVEDPADRLGIAERLPEGGQPVRLDEVVGVAEGQQLPRAALTPTLRVPAAPRAAAASTHRTRSCRSAHCSAAAGLSSDEPLSATTSSQSSTPCWRARASQLVLEPRHAVAHREYHADHRIRRTLVPPRPSPHGPIAFRGGYPTVRGNDDGRSRTGRAARRAGSAHRDGRRPHPHAARSGRGRGPVAAGRRGYAARAPGRGGQRRGGARRPGLEVTGQDRPSDPQHGAGGRLPGRADRGLLGSDHRVGVPVRGRHRPVRPACARIAERGGPMSAP